MAVFETIGVRQGTALFLEEHLQRGLEACLASAFPVDETWFRQAEKFLRKNLKPSDNGVVRIHVTAGDGAPADPSVLCRMLLTLETRPPISPELYQRGYHVGICPTRFQPTFDGRKTHNYWLNVSALQTARAAGADESLVFNPKEELVSACMANVFVVLKNEQIVTPALASGGRAGIVRQWVMCQEDIQEATIQRKDLRQAREVFLTSSWLGVMPVAKLQGRELNKRAVSSRLLSKYHCE